MRRAIRLFRNKGNGTFAERTSEAGLVGEVGALNIQQTDYNNDGYLDLWLMRGGWLGKAGRIPSSLLRNNGDGTFADVTEEVGLLRSHPTMACRWFDYDNDGWEDVYATCGGAFAGDFARNALYHNPGSTNKWLKLRLVGTRANRAAIGARVRVEVRGPAGSRELHRVVSSGGCFGGNPLRQEIGLSNATNVASVEIVWPGSGTRQVLQGLEVNHSYEVREGSDPVVLKTHPVNIRHAPLRRMAPLFKPASRTEARSGSTNSSP